MRKKSLVSESHPKALVCLNGAPLEKSFLVSRVASVDYVVAVDGGLNGLIESGITPDIVIGDLDSAKPEYIKKVRSLHMPDQYSTDLEKAFEHLKKIQITNVDVVGIEAGRVDHFLSNFFLLWKYVSDFSIQVRGVDWIGIFLAEKNKIILQPDTVVSLIPFTDCQGVTLDGFEYPLQNHNITLGNVGISNISRAEQVDVLIKSGKMLGIVYDVDMKWTCNS